VCKNTIYTTAAFQRWGAAVFFSPLLFYSNWFKNLFKASNKMMCATACLQAVLLEVPEKHCLLASSGTQLDL
jgi:hypothetical protein